MIENLAPGDEIVTNGGVAGKIVELQDNFLVIKIAKDVDVTFQKSAVAMVLPKGTLKTV